MIESTSTAQTLSESKKRWPLLCISVTFGLLSFRLFRLISAYAVNIFFSDQWDYDNATLFEPHTLWQKFAWQHGPHRQGLGAIVQSLLEPLLRWNSRGEAFLATSIVTLAAFCAIALKKRLWGRLSYSDVVIPLIFFTPAQYESLWVTPNISHGPLPLLLVVLYCIAWTLKNKPQQYSLVLFINFITIYTGFGLFVGFLTPVLLALDHWLGLTGKPVRRPYFLATLAVSVVSLGSFFHGYVSQPAADCFSTRFLPLTDYGAFVSLILAHFVGIRDVGVGSGPDASALLIGLGILIGMALSLGLACKNLVVKPMERRVQLLIPAILISYCLLFCTFTSYGRLCLGLGTALSSRYTNYVELGMLGLYFFLLTLENRHIRHVLIGLGVLAMAASLPVKEKDRNTMQSLHNIKSLWRSCYLSTENIEHCDKISGLGVYPEPEATHLKEKLEFLKRTRQNLYSDLR